MSGGNDADARLSVQASKRPAAGQRQHVQRGCLCCEGQGDHASGVRGRKLGACALCMRCRTVALNQCVVIRAVKNWTKR